MKQLKKILKRWYLPLIAGVLYILCGIWAIAVPVGSFIALSLFISIGILTSGIIEFFYTLTNSKNTQNWGWHLAGGLLSILIGFALLTNIQLTLTLFSTLIGFWILFRAFSIFLYAFDRKKRGEKRWSWFLVVGLFAALLSSVLLFNPLFLGTMVGIWIGICLLIIGIVHILISVLLNRLNRLRTSFSEKLDDYVEIKSQINSVRPDGHSLSLYKKVTNHCLTNEFKD